MLTIADKGGKGGGPAPPTNIANVIYELSLIKCIPRVKSIPLSYGIGFWYTFRSKVEVIPPASLGASLQ